MEAARGWDSEVGETKDRRMSGSSEASFRYAAAPILEMERPPQLQYEQNWDATIDLTLKRFVYGSLSGAASALLFFRSPTTRWAAVAFGAGAGIGSAFTDSSQLFRGAVGANFSSISSPSLAVVPDVQQSSRANVPEPKHVEAPKLERFEEPLIQEAQEA